MGSEQVSRLDSATNDRILAKYEDQFPYVRALRMIKTSYGKKSKFRKQLADAVEAGCVEIFKYLTKGKSVLPQFNACFIAASGGHLDMLDLVHQYGYKLDLSVAHQAVA